MFDSPVWLVFLLHAAATLFMVGVIWFVQIVHYPLLARVGRAEAADYEQDHTRRTAWVVAPPMLLEAATAFLMVWVRPPGVTAVQAGFGLGLLAIVWVSTRVLQVPCHERLSQSFDPGTHRWLVTTNWLRTICWSLRGLLVLWMANDTLALFLAGR